MLYDIRLRLKYDYPATVEGGRHHLRTVPLTLASTQRVIASSLTVEPGPSEQSVFRDFFGNAVTSIAYRAPHDSLDVLMQARVKVAREQRDDISPPPNMLGGELNGQHDLGAQSPWHFLPASHHAPIDAAITAYARESAEVGSTLAVAADVCRRIYEDFSYEPDTTAVSTLAPEAFALRHGVCQDFSHVMISGLRGIGIPAGYVSGFIRTIAPPGEERLEGADAMHAWVRVWCGAQMGWVEFDPTNNMAAGNDHIVIGYGRDYADVSPIVGVLRTTGKHSSEQSVDVIPIG
jgi:transglutaminase-like putative cysteine protease